MEITAVEMDGQMVLVQDCRSATAVARWTWWRTAGRVWGAQCPACHGLRVAPYWLAGDWTA